MVRTKADNCSKKAVAAKAPRKILASSTNSSASCSGLSSPSSGGKISKYAGGNPVCDRPTPDWQKGISAFLKKLPEKENSGEQTATENTEVDCVTMEAVGASSQTSSSSATEGSTSQRNGIVDSDED